MILVKFHAGSNREFSNILGALPLVEGEGCEALSSRHVGSPGITQTLMEQMQRNHEES